MTTTLADQIRTGYVAGPFDGPLMKKLRDNPIMAVVERTTGGPIFECVLPDW